MKHFKIEEFDCPGLPGSGEIMDQCFLKMLDKAREIYGRPMRVNSGYRTKEHNAKIGGVKNSSHILGIAADISCKTSKDRFDMVNAFIEAGFKRIGVGSSFIHVDIDENKSQNLIWTYY
jgi:uncharacterized protein YcbK (DUF882 family)